MKLFYAQGACSLAPHIILREAGIAVELEPVNLKTHRSRAGDYTQINPKGYVPAIELPEGEILTEAAVILQYIADLKPEKNLLPKQGTLQRYRALETLNFIATEIHKGFGPLWYDKTPAETKERTKMLLSKRLDLLEERMSSQAYLLGDQYTVADAYLFTCLNWAPMLEFDMTPWKAVLAYYERVKSRPATQDALKAEGLLK